MIYGYARVSTIGQERNGNSLIDQEKQLRENGAVQVYHEAYTGTKADRPVFTKLLEQVQTGDTIVVTKLDRLSRSVIDGAILVRDLLAKDVSVHILNMGMIDNTPTGKLFVHMLFAFAEFERDMIVQRTSEGKAIAKQREGYREGRKRKEIDLTEYRERVSNGEMSVVDACEQLGISKQTWYNRMKELSA